jgi:hypothetical protein
MAVDSLDMQRRYLKILIRDAIKAERQYKKANSDEGKDVWALSVANLELIEALRAVQGAAYIRYGCITSSALYRWTRRYVGVPHKFDCCKQI